MLKHKSKSCKIFHAAEELKENNAEIHNIQQQKSSLKLQILIQSGEMVNKCSEIYELNGTRTLLVEAHLVLSYT